MAITLTEKESRILTTLDLVTHLVLTLLFAWFFYWLTGRWEWPVLSVVGGILIDLDHFIDYHLCYGLKFNIGDFFHHRYATDSGKCYVFLHSWEIIALLWIISAFFPIVTPLAAGMTLHLLTDFLISHRGEILFLSLIYRWYHGFNWDRMSTARYIAG